MASLPPWWWLGWARGNTFQAMSWGGLPWDGLSATTCMASGTTATSIRNGPLRREFSTAFASAPKGTSDAGPRRREGDKLGLPGMARSPLWNLPRRHRSNRLSVQSPPKQQHQIRRPAPPLNGTVCRWRNKLGTSVIGASRPTDDRPAVTSDQTSFGQHVQELMPCAHVDSGGDQFALAVVDEALRNSLHAEAFRHLATVIEQHRESDHRRSKELADFVSVLVADGQHHQSPVRKA